MVLTLFRLQTQAFKAGLYRIDLFGAEGLDVLPKPAARRGAPALHERA